MRMQTQIVVDDDLLVHMSPTATERRPLNRAYMCTDTFALHAGPKLGS